MKAVIYYYNGNDYMAKLVEFMGMSGPHGLEDADLATKWNEPEVTVNAVLMVPEDTKKLYVRMDDNYMIIDPDKLGTGDEVTLELEPLEF